MAKIFIRAGCQCVSSNVVLSGGGASSGCSFFQMPRKSASKITFWPRRLRRSLGIFFVPFSFSLSLIHI